MPFYTFADGQTLPASRMNDIMRQTIVACTSGTRPSSPPVGMRIYETDTRKSLEWNGVRWDPPWSLPWGWVHDAVYNNTTPGTITVNGDSTFWSTGDWSAYAGRCYEVSITGLQILAESTISFAVGIWKYSGVTPNWEQLGSLYAGNLNVGERFTLGGFGLWKPTANHTVSAWVSHDRISATGQVRYELNAGSLARIVIKDIGPGTGGPL